ncbi:hypothetical protein FB451DRAFT_1367725 [Mycena latifolia]|nr:hypothetical protein FB451DRAFT_1367725 [Mycena latifolia]
MYTAVDPLLANAPESRTYPHPLLWRVHYAIGSTLNWGTKEVRALIFGCEPPDDERVDDDDDDDDEYDDDESTYDEAKEMRRLVKELYIKDGDEETDEEHEMRSINSSNLRNAALPVYMNSGCMRHLRVQSAATTVGDKHISIFPRFEFGETSHPFSRLKLALVLLPLAIATRMKISQLLCQPVPEPAVATQKNPDEDKPAAVSAGAHPRVRVGHHSVLPSSDPGHSAQRRELIRDRIVENGEMSRSFSVEQSRRNRQETDPKWLIVTESSESGRVNDSTGASLTEPNNFNQMHSGQSESPATTSCPTVLAIKLKEFKKKGPPTNLRRFAVHQLNCSQLKICILKASRNLSRNRTFPSLKVQPTCLSVCAILSPYLSTELSFIVAVWSDQHTLPILADVEKTYTHPSVPTVLWVRNVALWILGGLVNLNAVGESALPLNVHPEAATLTTFNPSHLIEEAADQIKKPHRRVARYWQLAHGVREPSQHVKERVKARSAWRCVLTNILSRGIKQSSDTHHVAHIIAKHCSPDAMSDFRNGLQALQVDFPLMRDLNQAENLVWLLSTAHGPFDREKWAVYVPTYALDPQTYAITAPGLEVHQFKDEDDLIPCPHPLRDAIDSVNAARAEPPPTQAHAEGYTHRHSSPHAPLAAMYSPADPRQLHSLRDLIIEPRDEEDDRGDDSEEEESDAAERERHLEDRARYCHFIMGNFLRAQDADDRRDSEEDEDEQQYEEEEEEDQDQDQDQEQDQDTEHDETRARFFHFMMR